MTALEKARYSSVAVALHWAIAVLILAQIAGGFYMNDLPNTSPAKFALFQLHKSFGLSILLLAVLRLGWRLMHKPPALPAAMPGWQKFAARAVHWGFYAAIILTPLVGWSIVSVSPKDIPTLWFGLFHVPHLPFFTGVTDRHAMEDLFEEQHETLAYIILFLFALHVGAALKHVFIDKDGVFASMAPARAGQWLGVIGILGVLGAAGIMFLLAPEPAAITPPPQTEAAALEEAETPTADVAMAPDETEAVDDAMEEASPAMAPAEETAEAETATMAAPDPAPSKPAVKASAWSVDKSASTLKFSGMEKDRRFEGTFSDFDADIVFDPDDLAGSSIRVDVRTKSASTGDALRDSTIPGEEWFDVSNHPEAVFVSNDIRSTGGNAYEAAGTLQIKGYEHPVTLAFTVDIDSDKAVSKGGVDLVRTNYGLGDNASWLDEEGVALAVRVDFEIHAMRKK